jgi:hypothetical protein
MSTDASTEPTVEELAAQEAAAAAETPPADPPADPPTDPPEDKDPPSSDPEPVNEHMAWLEKETGFKFSDRYNTDADAGQGIKHALQLVGQKNEDAAEMRELRDKLSPEQLVKLKSGEAQDPAAPAKESKLPTTHREYQLLIDKATKMEKEGLPGYQDDPEYRRAIAAQQEMSERAFQAPQEVADLKAEVAELKKGLSSQQAGSQAAIEKQQVDEWTARHAGELFQEDGQLTALGALTDSTFKTDPLCDEKSGQTKMDRFEIALRTAKGNLPASGGTKEPGKNATQQPGTRTTPKKSTYEELLKQQPNNPAGQARAFELFNAQCLAEDKAAQD